MKVEFNSGVVDKLSAACRFLLKAQAAGAAVVVCGDRAMLDRLDQALWSFDPHSFVAHVRLKGSGVPAEALSRTPIWLVDDPAKIAAREILLNLGPAMVEGWETFERIVEIVSTEAGDADAGRQRWRDYSTLPGLELVHQPRTASS